MSWIQYRVEIDIYRTIIHVIIATDFEEARKETELPLGPDPINVFHAACVRQFTHRNGAAGYVVFLRPKALLNTLVHESLHLATFILDDRGIEFDRHNHEAYAYLQEYIFDGIRECYKLEKVSKKK